MLLPTLAAMVVLLAAVCAWLGAAWRALAEERPTPPLERTPGVDPHTVGVLNPPYWVAPTWLVDEDR